MLKTAFFQCRKVRRRLCRVHPVENAALRPDRHGRLWWRRWNTGSLSDGRLWYLGMDGCLGFQSSSIDFTVNILEYVGICWNMLDVAMEYMILLADGSMCMQNHELATSCHSSCSSFGHDGVSKTGKKNDETCDLTEGMDCNYRNYGFYYGF